VSDYMPILELLSPGTWPGEALPTGHAWSEGSGYVECGKRILGYGWMVNAVAWPTDPSHEFAPCPDCIVALERRRLLQPEHGTAASG